MHKGGVYMKDMVEIIQDYLDNVDLLPEDFEERLKNMASYEETEVFTNFSANALLQMPWNDRVAYLFSVLMETWRELVEEDLLEDYDLLIQNNVIFETVSRIKSNIDNYPIFNPIDPYSIEDGEIQEYVEKLYAFLETHGKLAEHDWQYSKPIDILATDYTMIQYFIYRV
jgi:hypothetical protein